MRSVLPMIALVASAVLPCHSRAVAADGASMALPLTARGNEPGWLLTFDGNRLVYTPQDGAGAVDVALPEVENRDGKQIYHASEADLTVTLQAKVCRDTMTGMPSPVSVSVRRGAETVEGCGGNPVDLLTGGEWRVTAIGDQSVAEDVTVSMDFDATAGNVAGSSGCNRYFGGFSLTGEGFSFKQGMAGSMMACEDHKSKTEAAFLAALTKIDRFDIGPDGGLLLMAGNSVTIEAAREQKN